MFNIGDSFVAERDIVRPVRDFVAVRASERYIGVAVRDFVAVRAVITGFAVREVTTAPVERVGVLLRWAIFAVVERAATFFVALRGSVAPGVVAVRALVVPVRAVAVDNFCDCVTVFVPRDGADVDTFAALVLDAARTISS